MFYQWIQFSKIYRVYSFNLRRFSVEFVVIATICFVFLDCGPLRESRPVAQIAAGGADSGGTWGWDQRAVGGGELT
jgi:hypothetical protein